jgi:SAM-dependent methyltransferase
MAHDYNKNYYERLLSKEKENSQRNKLRLEELLLRKECGNLLEIGCGLGGFIMMARKYFNAECLEISTYGVKSLQGVQGVQVKIGDIETVNLPTNAYDVVVAFNILEHLRFPDNAIHKIKNSITHGGLFFGSIPNNYGVIGRMVTLWNNSIDRTHCSTYPLSTWELLFKETFEKADFFGEILFGRNHCIFMHSRNWKQISFNAIFSCEKY